MGPREVPLARGLISQPIILAGDSQNRVPNSKEYIERCMVNE